MIRLFIFVTHMSRVLVPSKVSMAVTKHHDQKEPEEDRVISVHSSQPEKSWWELATRTWRQKMVQRPWTNTPYWLAQPAFLCTCPEPPALGWHQPQWSGPSYINH